MKAEDIFSAIGEIDEDIIASSSKVKKPKRKIILMIGSLAACIVFAGVGVLAVVSSGNFLKNESMTAAPQQGSQISSEGAEAVQKSQESTSSQRSSSTSESLSHDGKEQYAASSTDNYNAITDSDHGTADGGKSVIYDNAANVPAYEDAAPEYNEDGIPAESEQQEDIREESLFQEDIAREESFDISNGEDIAAEAPVGTVDIYYLQDGILQSVSEELNDTQAVFDEWKKLNGIGEEVQLVETWTEYSDSSVEYSSYDGESGAAYSPGGGVFMVRVSKELENYYDTLDLVLLRVSLRNTMSSSVAMPSDCYRCDLVVG